MIGSREKKGGATDRPTDQPTNQPTSAINKGSYSANPKSTGVVVGASQKATSGQLLSVGRLVSVGPSLLRLPLENMLYANCGALR